MGEKKKGIYSEMQIINKIKTCRYLKIKDNIRSLNNSSRDYFFCTIWGLTAKKAMSSFRRDRLSAKRNQMNRARKSAIATRVKKVLINLNSLNSIDTVTEAKIKPVEQLISMANSEIDKAVGKGVLHINTGSRRKSKIAAAKKNLLIQKGIYTPIV